MTKKITKSFLKARAKSSIKPVLNGVYINKDEGVMVCTDTWRLHQIATPSNSFPTGIYNIDTMQIVNGTYPDYKQLLNITDLGIECTIDELKSNLTQSTNRDNLVYMYNNYIYNKKYIDDALELMNMLDDTFIIKVSSKGMLYIGSKNELRCFAIIMCINNR